MNSLKNSARSFEDKPAARDQVPLLVALMGPSGGGKTFSALRLATGFQNVGGGDIFVIDTEAKRSLHYSDVFRFRHVHFEAPFGPLDYLAAIEHCVSKGAGTIIIDSMSHEHDGPGGVLEMHESEAEELASKWRTTRDKVQLTAWAKPKQQRRTLINRMLQFTVNFICCFRAKEKLKVVKGGQPQPLGFMPIAGDEFVYEMTTSALLLPGAGGVPEWNPGEVGERQMVKLPRQFRGILSKREPLSEDIGEAMARWAAGEQTSAQPDAERLERELTLRIDAAESMDELASVGEELKRVRKGKLVPPQAFKHLTAQFKARKGELENNTREPGEEG